jgi:hypothetical protein
MSQKREVKNLRPNKRRNSLKKVMVLSLISDLFKKNKENQNSSIGDL